MGIAEVIPGVSGGTIAFITGIYHRLLHAVNSVGPALLILRKEGLVAAWKKLDGNFLFQLFIGMAIGFGLGLFAVTYLLEHQPILIWSFFFGLIFMSIPIIGKQVKKWRWQEVALLVLGAVFVYWVSIAAPSQGSSSLPLVFLSGMLAISALMLPGLSGSFVLLLLGMYTIVMPSIKAFIQSPFGPETALLIAFGAGMIIGLFSFARLLDWTFNRFSSQTMALLTGFLIGSLNKVWPWQEVLETRISDGEEKVMFSKSVSPSRFSELSDNFSYGTDPQILPALLTMVGAAVLVYILDRYSPQT